MSITGELRKWAEEHLSRSSILAIADRIDAEHQKAEDEWRAKNGDMWLKGYNVCHKELTEGHPVIVADLENAGWVKLPVDSDGVPIHVGDVMENLREDLEPSLHHRFTVYGIHYRAYGQECALTEDGYPSKLYRASETRHHHAPTVEDVLLELLDEAEHFHSLEEEREAIAEYAAKLRLAGDAE